MQRASALWPAVLPEGLSASDGAGVTRGAMMGDQSLRKRGWVSSSGNSSSGDSSSRAQAGIG